MFFSRSRQTFATLMVFIASYMRLHTELQNLYKLPRFGYTFVYPVTLLYV